MWYEILPGFAIMTVCMMIPGIATVQIGKLINGGKERKIARVPWQYYLVDRDRRISGSGRAYEAKGLDNIH